MSGYFSLPRSFTRDPLWLDLSIEYQHVFLVILDHACWKNQKFDDHGVIIDLKPGQLCTTERDLAKKCNKKITRIIVQRAIEKLETYRFLIREVSHIKSIISIIDKRVYDLIVKEDEPGNEPRLSQDRAKIEPQIKKIIRKEDNQDDMIDNAHAREKVIFKSKSKESALVSISRSELFRILQEDLYSNEEIEKAIKTAQDAGSSIMRGCIPKYLSTVIKNERKKSEQYMLKPKKDYRNAKQRSEYEQPTGCSITIMGTGTEKF